MTETNQPNSVLAIVGPTASGKTALVIALSRIMPGLEVVNVDAVQVFQGMDVATTKPSLEERVKLKHHMVDILDPLKEKPTAGWFSREARRCIQEILERGNVPILVGGSGLYLEATLNGIADIPEIDLEVKLKLAEDLERVGLSGLRIELAAVDPISAERIAPRDKQRTLRALEVYRATGTTLSQWQNQGKPESIPAIIAGLDPPRDLLYARIEDRLDGMFNADLEKEVRILLEAGADVEGAALGSLGYRHMAMFILGVWSREQALRQAKLDTRHYAKRQLTFLRSVERIRWWSVAPEEVEALAEDIAEWFGSEMGNKRMI